MLATMLERPSTRLVAFLAATADARRPLVEASDVALVIAHPDDETVACGAALARWDGVHVIVVTDGAPRDLGDARAKGFATAASYARARSDELEAALAQVAVAGRNLVRFEVPDQRAAFELSDLAHGLAVLFQARRIRLAVSHAYEGGHPDHDATAFAVHAAARLRARTGDRVGVVEMPFYRAGPDRGLLAQRFEPVAGLIETTVALDAGERALKLRMIGAYATQAETLTPFALDAERYRPAPGYDFTRLPCGGQLLYERFDWGMTGTQWQRLTRRAVAELGLEATSC